MNNVFKNKFLHSRGDKKRLESLLRTLCERILPSYLLAYVNDNLRSAIVHRKRHQIPLPSFAAGRPGNVVNQLIERQQRGMASVAITPLGDPSSSCFLVEKSNDTLGTMLKEGQRAGKISRDISLKSYKERLGQAERCYQVRGNMHVG